MAVSANEATNKSSMFLQRRLAVPYFILIDNHIVKTLGLLGDDTICQGSVDFETSFSIYTKYQS